MRREEGKTEMPQPDEFSALSPELQLNAKIQLSRIRVRFFIQVQCLKISAWYSQAF
jgi:hypothetical protein